MSKPLVNIDEWQRWVTLDESELRELPVSGRLLERLRRMRALYAHWLQFPSKFNQDLVRFDMDTFGVAKSQAYDDLHLVQTLLGNMQQASKEFMRWKINQDLEHDLVLARRAGDLRAVASIEKARILNNRTDKADEPEIEYDKIAPQLFEPTDDPSVIGIKRLPNLRERIERLKKRYERVEELTAADFEDVEEEENGGAQPAILQ